jgi:hypothetical protein
MPWGLIIFIEIQEILYLKENQEMGNVCVLSQSFSKNLLLKPHVGVPAFLPNWGFRLICAISSEDQIVDIWITWRDKRSEWPQRLNSGVFPLHSEANHKDLRIHYGSLNLTIDTCALQATKNTQERSGRLENLCWRIWHMTRKKKEVGLSSLHCCFITKLHCEVQLWF